MSRVSKTRKPTLRSRRQRKGTFHWRGLVSWRKPPSSSTVTLVPSSSSCWVVSCSLCLATTQCPGPSGRDENTLGVDTRCLGRPCVAMMVEDGGGDCG